MGDVYVSLSEWTPSTADLHLSRNIWNVPHIPTSAFTYLSPTSCSARDGMLNLFRLVRSRTVVFCANGYWISVFAMFSSTTNFLKWTWYALLCNPPLDREGKKAIQIYFRVNISLWTYVHLKVPYLGEADSVVRLWCIAVEWCWSEKARQSDRYKKLFYSWWKHRIKWIPNDVVT